MFKKKSKIITIKMRYSYVLKKSRSTYNNFNILINTDLNICRYFVIKFTFGAATISATLTLN